MKSKRVNITQHNLVSSKWMKIASNKFFWHRMKRTLSPDHFLYTKCKRLCWSVLVKVYTKEQLETWLSFQKFTSSVSIHWLFSRGKSYDDGDNHPWILLWGYLLLLPFHLRCSLASDFLSWLEWQQGYFKGFCAVFPAVAALTLQIS